MVYNERKKINRSCRESKPPAQKGFALKPMSRHRIINSYAHHPSLIHYPSPPRCPFIPFLQDFLPPSPRLNRRPTSPPRTSPSMPHPENSHANRANQPQQRIHKINPNSMFHPQDPRIALRIRFNIHVSEQAEQCDPQDEQDRVPDERHGDACREGDEVDQCGDG